MLKYLELCRNTWPLHCWWLWRDCLCYHPLFDCKYAFHSVYLCIRTRHSRRRLQSTIARGWSDLMIVISTTTPILSQYHAMMRIRVMEYSLMVLCNVLILTLGLYLLLVTAHVGICNMYCFMTSNDCLVLRLSARGCWRCCCWLFSRLDHRCWVHHASLWARFCCTWYRHMSLY